MHRGVVPSTQPRTARSNAEQKGTTPNGFVGDIPYSPQAGAPLSTLGAGSSYRDEAIAEGVKHTKRFDAESPFVVTRHRK